MWELESETQGSAPALCCDTYEQNNYTGGYREASANLGSADTFAARSESPYGRR